MKILLLPVFALSVTLQSCHPQPPTRNGQADRVVFGTFYGECGGDCVDIFAADKTSLREDEAASYSSISWVYTFSGTTMLPPAKHAIAVSLLDGIPPELLTATNVQYGAPDSHDQGGIYLLLEKGGVCRRFTIDHDSTADQSAALLTYKRRVHDVLAAIR